MVRPVGGSRHDLGSSHHSKCSTRAWGGGHAHSSLLASSVFHLSQLHLLAHSPSNPISPRLVAHLFQLIRATPPISSARCDSCWRRLR